MYICIYIYIYIYILSSSQKPSGRLLWFPSSTSSNVFNGFRRCVCMVSVVARNVFFYGFRRDRKTFCYGFRRWIFGGFCHRRRIQRFRMYRAIPRFVLCF